MLFNKKISIFGLKKDNSPEGGEPWGPAKVIHNLILGLKANNIKYSFQEEKLGDYNLLINNYTNIFQKLSPSKDNTFIGPCVEATFGSYASSYDHFLTASKWHKNYFKNCDKSKSKGKFIDHWPVGIDTDFYKPKKNIVYDCLFHYKHPRAGFNGWDIFNKIVKKFKLKTNPNISEHLVDGQYTGKQLVERCNSCKFLIVISGSETQGIGKMEMMSTNTPMFVLDSNTHWAFGAIGSTFPATTVPYWSKTCGIVLHERDYTKDFFQVKNPSCIKSSKSQNRLTKWQQDKLPKSKRLKPVQGSQLKIRYIYKKFENFLNELTYYVPRDYIMDKHTLKKSTENLINIFKKYE